MGKKVTTSRDPKEPAKVKEPAREPVKEAVKEPARLEEPVKASATVETKARVRAATRVEPVKVVNPEVSKGTTSGVVDDKPALATQPPTIQAGRDASVLQGWKGFWVTVKSKQSRRHLAIAIGSIAATLVIAFLLGQALKDALQTNASNGGHLIGILTTGIAFFSFTRHLKRTRDIVYIQHFTILYFLAYFLIVVGILIFIMIISQANIVYLYSTFGNALILFSTFVLIIFILNPEILGINGRNFILLFKTGQHVRVIGVYLFIALTQIAGFSLLNSAIHAYTGDETSGAAISVTGPVSWFDFFYLSTITFATIGYGDIHPLSPAAKLSTISQALLSHVISLLFLAILLLYLSSSIGGNGAEVKDQAA